MHVSLLMALLTTLSSTSRVFTKASGSSSSLGSTGSGVRLTTPAYALYRLQRARHRCNLHGGVTHRNPPECKEVKEMLALLYAKTRSSELRREADQSIAFAQCLQPVADAGGEDGIVERLPALVDQDHRRRAVEPLLDAME